MDLPREAAPAVFRLNAPLVTCGIRSPDVRGRNRGEPFFEGWGAGEGTAGALLKDKQLYENMNRTVAELSGLVAEIRKDPKKYLNIRVSIF